jgi:hypothetical protein
MGSGHAAVVVVLMVSRCQAMKIFFQITLRFNNGPFVLVAFVGVV